MVLGLLATYPTAAFFLDDLQVENICPAPRPCECEYKHYITYDNTLKSINCSKAQLRLLPAFKNTTTSVVVSSSNLFEAYLDNNQLTAIPAFAFQSLPRVDGTWMDGTRMSINLKDNNISLIDNDAFDGIASIVEKLNLQNNLLTYLPIGFSKLTSIKELNVLGNPLTHLDSVIMSSFSQILHQFSFSADHFTLFPNELRLLHNLHTLTVNRIPFHSLPNDAFQGFDFYFSELNIDNSKLDHIPESICNLTYLTHLAFTSSPNIKSSSSLFNNCNHYMSFVSSVSLYDNQLASLPNISGWFPRVMTLNLSTNHLQSLSLGYCPFLSDLDLSHNLFTQIPPALSNIRSLFDHLDMSGNQITSINDNDLQNLGYLHILELNNNPISHISPHAFKYNKQLREIGLKHTNLFQIPLALKELGNTPSPYLLPYHRKVDFTGSPINCSCVAMPYLRHWHAISLPIIGNCHGGRGTSIQRYVDHLFPATCS